jgi:predicted nucleic acid-binding Zn finger protein
MATRQTTPTDETVSDEQILDDRDVRALTECMTALCDGGSMFTVVGENGGTYRVDAKRGRCECEDMKHNLPDGDREECKHLARVRFAAGERAIPGWVDMDEVDPLLGDHLGGPRVAMTDGGQLFRESRDIDIALERVNGVVFVWDESPELGKDLLGFCDVTDEAALRQALIARGIGVGAIHHKERFDAAEVGL